MIKEQAVSELKHMSVVLRKQRYCHTCCSTCLHRNFRDIL